MREKLEKAIRNNNDLYEAIFKPQNIKFHRNDLIWYCLEKTPPLYSNLVTVSESWKPNEIFRAIDESFENENWKNWSIKDSFNVLDLSEYKFEKLFDAQWFYLEAAKYTPEKKRTNLQYKIIKNKKDLSDWRLAWDAVETLGKQIFFSELLNNRKIYFIAGYKNENIECGCLLNETEDILGISNFFTVGSKIENWAEIIEFVHDSIKSTDIVGYERNNFIRKIQPLGFEAVGNLSVWLRINKAAE